MTSVRTDLAAPAPDVPAGLDTSWSGALVAAMLASLEHPGMWAPALAGFLARGGILVFLAPIVILPTPAGLQGQLAPLLVPFVFGQASPGLAALVAALGALLLVWLVVGGLVGAWADVLLARHVAESLDVPVVPRAGRAVAAACVARLLAHVPLAIALGWGAARLFEVTYGELVTPFEVTTPLAVRIATGAPDALLAIVIAWLLGEAAGGLAVREIAVGGRGVLGSLLRGWVDLLGRPLSSLGTLVASNVLVAVAILPALVAAATAWAWLRLFLFERGRPEGVAIALAIFVGLWLGGLVLAGVATALRSAAWTGEWSRRRAAQWAATASEPWATGTIGEGHATDRGG